MWDKRGDMVVHTESPFNAESPRSVLAQSDVTPIDTFYSRNHGPVPDLKPQQWRLRVDGMVTDALRLTFGDLAQQFPVHTVEATLQCAGNRRAGFNDVRNIDGEDPWGPGATSTAQWLGTRLADVLDAAGASRQKGLHVAFDAPDVSDLASPAQTYGSSIPLAKAMSDEVLLAWEMNGRPLPRIHGGPVRVVVPGFIGARSVKWIAGISVQRAPSTNYFQAVAYRILPVEFDPDTAGPGDGISLSSVALNSDILFPDDGDQIDAGPLTIRGYAFAGDDRGVARVDISLDDGRNWRQATLLPQRSCWAWQIWTFSVDVTPGPLSVTARAWDTTGALQPESAASLWNPKGYANNSWAHVHAFVV